MEAIFDTAGIQDTILQVLAEAHTHRRRLHGRNFINVYTLAERVAVRNPAGVVQLGFNPDGTSTTPHRGLAAYLASTLVRRVEGGYLPQVEIAWEDTVDAMFRLRS